jgi:bifunctional non-homologous end joining protein LigD
VNRLHQRFSAAPLAARNLADREGAAMNNHPAASQSNLDKPYWPDDGFTKLDMMRYYERAFPRLEPWLKDRLLVFERCPDGIRGSCFWQKQVPDGMPGGTRTTAISHEDRTTNYVVGGARRTLAALAALGCVAIHVWPSRARAPRRPDWMAFDLDPMSGRFADAVQAARWLREVLDEVGLQSYPKTSGGRGLHVLAPLRVGPECSEVLDLARAIASALVQRHPSRLTMETRKEARGGRVYVDVLRNAFAQTVVAPYSLRALPHAPVSTPLDWDEVDARLEPATFNLETVLRLRRADPWAEFFRRRQALEPARRLLARMGATASRSRR